MSLLSDLSEPESEAEVSDIENMLLSQFPQDDSEAADRSGSTEPVSPENNAPENRIIPSDNQHNAVTVSDLVDLKTTMVAIKDLLTSLVRQGGLPPGPVSGSSSPLTSDSVSTPSRKKAKRDIGQIRQETRKVYEALLEENENFKGWDLSPGTSFNSPQNKATQSFLIQEVSTINPSFEGSEIRNAAYRFFRTRKEGESATRRGLAPAQKVNKRRHERIVRKKKDRQAAISRSTKLTADQKAKWMKVLTNEFMSSEESDDDDSVVVHPIPWRSAAVNKMLEKMSGYIGDQKSPQAKRQMKKRRIGTPSTRPKPSDHEYPTWSILCE